MAGANDKIYQYILAALLLLLTGYVSYSQGASQAETKVQTAINIHEAADSKIFQMMNDRLARIEAKLDRHMDRNKGD
jgi:hypothetical protein